MIPQEIVRQVRRIQFQIGREVADVLAGHYLSVFKGQGMEFEEVRPYVPGDDVRSIDWNVTARVGAPYVKRYTEERELTVMLLVDMSASQDFGSAGRSKRQAAVELSALLAFAAIENDDKVGLLLFHGDIEEYIPPRKGQRHALRVVREVLSRGVSERVRGRGEEVPRSVLGRLSRLILRRRAAQRAGKATDIGAALEFTRRVLPRRAVLFLVSDFLDEGYTRALRGARSKHDVICALITDERELRIEGAGLIEVMDAETRETRLIDTSSRAFQAQVAEAAALRLSRLRAELRQCGIDLMHIEASRPVVDPLMAFFRMRERRQRR